MGNLGTADFPVYRDDTGPTITLDVPDYIHVHYPLTWEALDPEVRTGAVGSGVRDFTVEYSENGGPWVELVTDLTESQVEFIGTPGATYDIRVTAYDNVNNTEIALKEDVKIKAVTKYYALGGPKVGQQNIAAMRQGDGITS